MKNTNFLNGKKLIILSIVLLTSLSATFIGNFSEEKKQAVTEQDSKTEFEKDMELTKKLKLFNAKDYLKEYEHKKAAKKMLNESTGRFELTTNR